MYFIVFVIMRIMGKREIGKLSVFDLVISIMIAEIAVFALEDTKRPLWESVVPMIVLVVVQITLAWISLKSKRVRTWFDGKPSVIIARGHLLREEMRKMRYNLDDLMLQLREQGIDNVDQVEYAIMESTGKLTVFTKETVAAQQQHFRESLQGSQTMASSSRLSSNQALKQPEMIRFTELPLPLIMDGRVLDENLERINKTRFWLKNQIHMKGVRDFKEVFLCSIDHKGFMYVDKKDALQ